MDGKNNVDALFDMLVEAGIVTDEASILRVLDFVHSRGDVLAVLLDEIEHHG